ncbi:MAG TPA: type II toxin-antitoxin system VapC family toxin [Ktedonobacterales bacterium]
MDASLVLHLLLYDERDAAVVDLWQEWALRRTPVICPVLLYAEVTSVLRLRVSTGRLTPEEGDAAFSAFNALGIQRLDRDDLHVRAWTLSAHYGTRRAYDMTYLALAQLEDCDLWTGDERFVNTLAGREPRAHCAHWAHA